MALTINTNIVNDTGGYIVETKNVKAGEVSGETLMLDDYLTAEAETVAGKEDRMDASGTWPAGNLFKNNGLYALGTVSGEKTLSFENGASSEDMLYVSFPSGGVNLTFGGSNHMGLSDLAAVEDGAFAEMIGLWNPGLEKWVFTWRTVDA